MCAAYHRFTNPGLFVAFDSRYNRGSWRDILPDQTPQVVLVVDDEPEIRKLVSAILTRQGYRVYTADDGENALRLFKTLGRVDLLLTDVVAPGLSGPMIADHLAELQPGLKVLFMSGYDATQVVQRYVVEKGYSLLVKPFTPSQLLEKAGAVMAAAA